MKGVPPSKGHSALSAGAASPRESSELLSSDVYTRSDEFTGTGHMTDLGNVSSPPAVKYTAGS